MAVNVHRDCVLVPVLLHQANLVKKANKKGTSHEIGTQVRQATHENLGFSSCLSLVAALANRKKIHKTQIPKKTQLLFSDYLCKTTPLDPC